MKQHEMIEEFCKIDDIRLLLAYHPDKEMTTRACLHYLGDAAQAWYEKSNGTNNVYLGQRLTWKEVFNSNVGDYYMWRNNIHASKAAFEAGYKFFTWNGFVYTTNECINTEILIESL